MRYPTHDASLIQRLLLVLTLGFVLTISVPLNSWASFTYFACQSITTCNFKGELPETVPEPDEESTENPDMSLDDVEETEAETTESEVKIEPVDEPVESSLIMETEEDGSDTGHDSDRYTDTDTVSDPERENIPDS